MTRHTPDPLAAAREALLQLEEDLTRRLANMDRTEERPGMNTAVGRLTFMDEYQQHQMNQAGRRNVESQLGRVRAALERIDNGE